MDLFFKELKSKKKLRLHFHRFMKLLHEDLNKLNALINKIVTKEKNSKKKVKDQGGTQSYNNYNFVFIIKS